jgi:Ser/Thr protein kinase RdoA (MazF antagonist)
MLGPEELGEIARAFGLGPDPELTGRAERGEQGTIWELATASGTWAVKTSFVPDAGVDGEDADFQTAACAAGVPAPRVIRTLTGDVFAEVGGERVRVYEWVELLALDRDLEPGRVGRVVATIHGVRFDGRRPQDAWYTDPVGAGWGRLIRELTAAGAPFAAEVAALHEQLLALEAVLEPASELRTCHRDLWADNVRGVVGGGVCVIDWENCGLADPGQELAGVLFEFANGDAGRARELYRAYRHCGGPGRVQRRGDFSMTIAQLGHITELSCRRWLEPATSEQDRSHHAARVRESVEEPLTLEVIDELLDAVSG